MKDREETKKTFIYNVHEADAHDEVEITVHELLDGDTEIPVITDGELFIDCLIAYFEYVEKYELCAELTNRKDELQERLIPLGKFMTKHHETLKNFGRRNRMPRDNDNLFDGL